MILKAVSVKMISWDTNGMDATHFPALTSVAWHRLLYHQIQLVSPERQLWVVMQSEIAGKVHVADMLLMK